MKPSVKAQKIIAKYPLVNRAVTDIRYRTTIAASFSLAMNIAFAAYNCFLGIYTTSAWFITMCFYYVLLGFMRFYSVLLFVKLQKIDTGERTAKEYKLMKTIGIVLLFLPIALSGTVVLTVNQGHIQVYSTIIMITIATYTFYKITLAIINFFRIRKYNSPLLTTIRNIGIADAAMSILPMQTSMIASFQDASAIDLHLMTILTGTGICCVFVAIGLTMIITSRRKLNWLNQNL